MYSPSSVLPKWSSLNDEDNDASHLEVIEPWGLMMVLRGEHAGVEEHQGHDQPEHPLRLADVPTLAPHRPVPSGNIIIKNSPFINLQF